MCVEEIRTSVIVLTNFWGKKKKENVLFIISYQKNPRLFFGVHARLPKKIIVFQRLVIIIIIFLFFQKPRIVIMFSRGNEAHNINYLLSEGVDVPEKSSSPEQRSACAKFKLGGKKN